MPNGEAHEALIRQAYGAIGLDMSGTAMVEAHGKIYSIEMTVNIILTPTSIRHRYESW